jgi:outer membrane protein assembly factor BamB
MKRVVTCLVAGLLSGCSWLSDENPEPPTPLADFKAAASVRELWSTDIGKGPGDAYLRLQPNLQRDALYTVDVRGRVRAVSLTDGKARWETDLDVEVTAAVGFGDDQVLIGSRKGDVIALDPATGQERWRAHVTSEVLAAPVADAGVTVVQTDDGHLTAFASDNGQRQWVAERPEPPLSLRGTATPVIVANAVLSGFASGKLMAVGLKDGRVLWEIPVAQPQGRSEIERLIDVDAPVLVAGRMLVAAAYQGKVVALSLEDGRLLWSREISSYSALAADANNVYVSDARGQVYALDLRSGATVWKQDQLLNRHLSAPALVGNAVAVGDFDGYVHWLSRDDGHFLARERASEAAILATPDSDGATLYVCSQDGDLVAYQLGPVAR